MSNSLHDTGLMMLRFTSDHQRGTVLEIAPFGHYVVRLDSGERIPARVRPGLSRDGARLEPGTKVVVAWDAQSSLPGSILRIATVT